MPADAILSRIRNLRTVFLDRDGVLNRKMPEGEWVTSPAELSVLPGAPAAVARLNRAGLLVLVVTNQRAIARGRLSPEGLERIHAALQSALRPDGAHIDAFFHCPHDSDECGCRKPLTGMFDQARRQFPQVDAATSVMIGDSLSDLQFGKSLGMLTLLLETNPEMRKEAVQKAAQLADACFPTLSAAVNFLLDGR
ncbi:MAG TPA: HAD family hydrolase [Terracidiphilus sp.]|nr:HAD family hydrolase [Terracidiphilus sp.]